jgi:hypothetical protein
MRAARIADRVRLGIAERLIDIGVVQIPATLSIGSVSAPAGSPESQKPEELVRAADMALHRARAKGRNRVEIASLCSCSRARVIPALRRAWHLGGSALARQCHSHGMREDLL